MGAHTDGQTHKTSDTKRAWKGDEGGCLLYTSHPGAELCLEKSLHSPETLGFGNPLDRFSFLNMWKQKVFISLAPDLQPRGFSARVGGSGRPSR